MSIDFAGWCKQVQSDMEQVLSRHLPSPGQAPAKLHSAMR